MFKARHIDIVIRQRGMGRKRKISYVTRVKQKNEIKEANSFVDSYTLSKKSPLSQVEQLPVEKQTRKILEFRYIC